MIQKRDWLILLRIGKRNKLEKDLSEYILSQLIKARKKKGLSQRQLGQMLRRSNAYISLVERLRLDLTVVDLIGLSLLLDEPIGYFLPISAEDDGKLSGQEWELVRQFRKISDEPIKEAAINQIGELARIEKKVAPH